MDLAEAVLARLLAAAPVTDRVGAGADARIRPGYRRQGDALPGIAYARVGGAGETETLEAMVEPIETRMDFNCYAATSAAAWALAAAVANALRDEADVDGFLFWNADVERPIDLGEDGAPGGFVHRTVQTVVFRHSADT